MNTSKAWADPEELVMFQNLFKHIQAIKTTFALICKGYIKFSNKAVNYPNRTVMFFFFLIYHGILAKRVTRAAE